MNKPMKKKKERPSMLKQLTVSDGSSAKPKSTARISAIGSFIFVVILLLAIVGTAIMDSNGVPQVVSIPYLIILVLIGMYLMIAMQVASQWEKAVVLRLGNFRKLSGPGLFWIIPIVDSVVNWI